MEPVAPPTQQNPSPQPSRPPVMDIKAPPRPVAAEPVRVAPPESGQPQPDSVELKKQDQKVSKPPKPPKVHGNGVALAVFATIIIVLGLGAMIMYAYLRTQGISVF